MSKPSHKSKHYQSTVVTLGLFGAVLLLVVGMLQLRGPAPSIMITSNNSGPISGGTIFIITGNGFRTNGTTQVWVGKQKALNFTVTSSRTIVVTAPPADAGEVAVTVINPDGRRASQNNAFRYSALKPVITMVEPNHGPTAGGTTVTIHGHGFQASAVKIQINTATVSPAVADDSTLTFITPPLDHVGQVNVVVKSADGFWSSDNANFLYE